MAGLVQSSAAARGIDAADAGVVGARADAVADAADGADQVDQALDVVGAARRRDRAPPSATLPLAGLMPTRRPPTPATSVSPTASITPGCAAAPGSRPVRCCVQRRRPLWPSQALVGAVGGLHEDAARRPPAARCTPAAVSCWRHSTLPPCSATSSLSRGDHRGQRAVAADAGRQRRAGAGAPEFAAGARHRSRPRCRRCRPP